MNIKKSLFLSFLFIVVLFSILCNNTIIYYFTVLHIWVVSTFAINSNATGNISVCVFWCTYSCIFPSAIRYTYFHLHHLKQNLFSKVVPILSSYQQCIRIVLFYTLTYTIVRYFKFCQLVGWRSLYF